MRKNAHWTVPSVCSWIVTLRAVWAAMLDPPTLFLIDPSPNLSGHSRQMLYRGVVAPPPFMFFFCETFFAKWSRLASGRL